MLLLDTSAHIKHLNEPSKKWFKQKNTVYKHTDIHYSEPRPTHTQIQTNRERERESSPAGSLPLLGSVLCEPLREIHVFICDLHQSPQGCCEIIFRSNNLLCLPDWHRVPNLLPRVYHVVMHRWIIISDRDIGITLICVFGCYVRYYGAVGGGLKGITLITV